MTTVSPSKIEVHIKCSKTDQYHKGARLQLVSLESSLCPVKNLTQYMAMRGCGPGPLFVFLSGDFLTRKNMVFLLRKALPFQTKFNTHSFRIGGATAAAMAGVSSIEIKKMGCWKSDAFMSYIRLPTAATDSAYLSLSKLL